MIESLSELSQTALDFARDCLGWEDVIALPEDSLMEEAAVIVRGDADTSLYYTDLNAVMDAVRGWIGERPLDLEIHLGNVADGYVVLLKRFERHGKHRVMADALSERSDNHCHALLVACVEAARKLRADNRTSSTGLVSVSKPHKEE